MAHSHFFYIIYCLWVCYFSLFGLFKAHLPPQGPFVYFMNLWSIIPAAWAWWLCHLFAKPLLPLLLGFFAFHLDPQKWPLTFSPLNIWSIPAIHMWIEDLSVFPTSLLSLPSALLNSWPLHIYKFFLFLRRTHRYSWRRGQPVTLSHPRRCWSYHSRIFPRGRDHWGRIKEKDDCEYQVVILG